MLQDSLKKVKDLTDLANSHVNPASPTAPAQRANKRNAKEALNGMFLEVQKEILDSSIFMIVTGPGAKNFSEMSVKHFDVFSNAAKDFYSLIAKDIHTANYLARPLTAPVVDLISSKISIISDEIGIKNPTYLVYKNSMIGKKMNSVEDLADNVKMLLETEIGLGVVGAYFLNKTTAKVINERFSGSTVPIMLVEEDEQSALNLQNGITSLTSKVVLINTGEVELANAITGDGKSRKTVQDTLAKVKKTISLGAKDGV